MQKMKEHVSFTTFFLHNRVFNKKTWNSLIRSLNDLEYLNSLASICLGYLYKYDSNYMRVRCGLDNFITINKYIHCIFLNFYFIVKVHVYVKSSLPCSLCNYLLTLFLNSRSWQRNLIRPQSVDKGKFPNNCILVLKVRKDILWPILFVSLIPFLIVIIIIFICKRNPDGLCKTYTNKHTNIIRKNLYIGDRGTYNPPTCYK